MQKGLKKVELLQPQKTAEPEGGAAAAAAEPEDVLDLAATARLYGVDEGEIFNDEAEMDGAISDTDANDLLADDDVAVTGMKCMCSDCTMAIPSAKKGGQRKESMKRPAGASGPGPIKGHLKLVKRLGKGGNLQVAT